MEYRKRRKIIEFYHNQWEGRKQKLIENDWVLDQRMDWYIKINCRKTYSAIDIKMLTNEEFDMFIRSNCIYSMDHVFKGHNIVEGLDLDEPKSTMKESEEV